MCCHGVMLCCVLPVGNCPHRSRRVLRAPGECSTLQQHPLGPFAVLPRQQAAAAELLPHSLHGCAAQPDRAPAPRAAWPSACPNDCTAGHCRAGHQVQVGGCRCPAAPLSIWSASNNKITTSDFSPKETSAIVAAVASADHAVGDRPESGRFGHLDIILAFVSMPLAGVRVGSWDLSFKTFDRLAGVLLLCSAQPTVRTRKGDEPPHPVQPDKRKTPPCARSLPSPPLAAIAAANPKWLRICKSIHKGANRHLPLHSIRCPLPSCTHTACSAPNEQVCITRHHIETVRKRTMTTQQGKPVTLPLT